MMGWLKIDLKWDQRILLIGLAAIAFMCGFAFGSIIYGG